MNQLIECQKEHQTKDLLDGGLRPEDHKFQVNLDDNLPESLDEHLDSFSLTRLKNADQCLEEEEYILNEPAIAPTINVQSHVQVPTISIPTTPTIPIQGEQACAHKCKDKKACRHLCCKEGVGVRVKRRLKSMERNVIKSPAAGLQSCSTITGKTVKVMTNEIRAREHERVSKWMHQYKFQESDDLDSDRSSETRIPVTPGIQSKEAFNRFISRFINS